MSTDLRCFTGNAVQTQSSANHIRLVMAGCPQQHAPFQHAPFQQHAPCPLSVPQLVYCAAEQAVGIMQWSCLPLLEIAPKLLIGLAKPKAVDTQRHHTRHYSLLLPQYAASTHANSTATLPSRWVPCMRFCLTAPKQSCTQISLSPTQTLQPKLCGDKRTLRATAVATVEAHSRQHQHLLQAELRLALLPALLCAS